MDPDTEAVEATLEVWAHRSFRNAVAALVGLDTEQLLVLKDMTREVPVIPIHQAAQRLSVSESQLDDANSALTYLYQRARDYGVSPKALAFALRDRIHADSEIGLELDDEKVKAVADLLARRPEYERSAAARAPLANLVGSSTSLTLHVVDDSTDSLVPMILVRLYFDETPQGGSSDVLAFQMPIDSATELMERVGRSVEKASVLPGDLAVDSKENS